MKLKDENESLKREINRLQLENENQKVAHEKKNSQEKMEYAENAEKLKEGVVKLNGEVESLKNDSKLSKTGNQFLKQQPVDVTLGIPKFVTDGDRLIEGVSRFIEGIEPKTKEFDSYTQWYDYASERMKERPYINPKYFLIRECGEIIDKSFVRFCTSSVGYYAPSSFTLPLYNISDHFLTFKNIKSVFILHPKNLQEFLELTQYNEYPSGSKGEFSYSWISEKCNDLKQYCKAVNDENYKTKKKNKKLYSMTLCAIKY